MKKIFQKIVLFSILAMVVSCSAKTKKQEPVTPQTALQSYLTNGDKTFNWEVKEKYKYDGLTAFDILLTSQNWRDHIWTHQLTIYVPDKIEYNGALLFITGGSIKDGYPNWKKPDNKLAKLLAPVAKENKALVAIVRQVPNQPLYNGLVEDQLISFTFHNFQNDNEYTWPLLFPMVKSAVRAMDVVQDFAKKELTREVSGFTVSGASKRGWTTWLTGASDKRVEAIAPMVIDVLNMPVSLQYQLDVWHNYSPQIKDYEKLGILQTTETPSGKALMTMVDPYSYREKLTMPKMIFMGTNDEYWPVDAVKNYIYNIPGENFIFYTPNAGHSLNGFGDAVRTLNAFWGRTLQKQPYPKFTTDIASDKSSVTITITTSAGKLLNAYCWSADSDDRDFRDEQWSKTVVEKNGEEVQYKINFPKKGFKAFYIDLECANLTGGSYFKSTRMFVVDTSNVL